MTEKTDIAAVRDKHEIALKDLTERLTECNRLNFCMDELSAFAAFSSTVIDQLEAERQQREAAEKERERIDRRNAELNSTLDRWSVERAESENEIEELRAALRGGQDHGDTTVYMMPNVFASLVNTARDVALEYKNAQCLRDALSRELKGYFILSRQPKPVMVHPDTVRMDWLCAHVVEVRQPMFYGSHAMFFGQCDSADDEEYHSKLREQIDAAIKAAGIVVKDGE